MRKGLLVILFIAFIILIILFVYLFNIQKTVTQNTTTVQKASNTMIPPKNSHMKITSSAFENNGTIPSKYTCDGQSINPPLAFKDIPANAKSLAMVMDDPDAPNGTFDHWVVYNIPPTVHEIGENNVPSGVSQGLNGTGKGKYTGPCPPDREHRYFFKLFALDSELHFDEQSNVTKQMVINKMQGHIIDQTELIGRYNRPQNQ